MSESPCPNCGSTDPQDRMGIQYGYDHPEHYDGVSEYRCKCGVRFGRWSELLLQEGESEKRFGGLN